jgi:hypothetical protein
MFKVSYELQVIFFGWRRLVACAFLHTNGKSVQAAQPFLSKF